MKHSKLFLMFLFLSLKGLSQQAVLTSSGEKVILNFLSSSGGTITGTLGVTGNTTISGTLTTGTWELQKRRFQTFMMGLIFFYKSLTMLSSV